MIGWAIETLVATSLTMLAVLAVRAPVRRAFGAGVAYTLWSLPVARLLMPPLPGDWRLTRLLSPLAQRAEAAPGIVAGVLDPATLPADVAAHATIASAGLGHQSLSVALVPPAAVAGGARVAMLVAGLWIAGAVLFFAYHLIVHARFCRRLVDGAVAGRTVAAGRVRVIESHAAAAPLAFGIWRPYVAFPADAASRWDADERALALHHELEHHRRGDLIANWAGLAMLALHWFNPIAWRAFRAFRADQEMATDARVLAGRSAVERHAYACAIVKAAHPGFGAVAATCHLNTVEDLKGRLKMLAASAIGARRRRTGIAVVAGATAGALALTASGSPAVSAPAATPVAAVPPAPTAIPRLPLMPIMAAMPAMAQATRRHPAAAAPAGAAEADEADDAASDDVAAPAPAAASMAPTTTGPVRVSVGDSVPRNFVIHVPEVTNARCPGDRKQPVVMSSTTRSGQRIVICTNRIETMGKDAAEVERNSAAIERDAIASARDSLAAATAAIESNRNLSAAQRQEALAGIAEAQQELASER